jgi:hypothetical protein
MLTREQIQRLAQRHRVGMQVQERDYVQHLLLGASEYDDVPPFVVSVLTPEHLLAEKVRALIVRAKPRDLYDVWLLLAQGVTLERGLVEQKLTLCGLNLTAAS